MKPLFFGEKTSPSPIQASNTLKGMLQSLIKEGCPVSQLIYKALFCKRYLNPKMKFNYISYREKQGMLSYCPYGKEQTISPDGKWAREGRQEIKPVKLAKDLLHPRLISKFKDHQLAEFATKFKAFEEGANVKFELIPVQDAYNTENAFKETTFGSCMADKPVGEFYGKFNVKALVARHRSGKLLGRALLWEEAKLTMGDDMKTVRFMDRVYAYNEAVTELFYQWVKENKVWRKERQSADAITTLIDPNGGVVVETTINVECVEGESLKPNTFFPYMDTLYLADTYTGIFNRRSATSPEFKIQYRNTDGNRYVLVDPDYVAPPPPPPEPVRTERRVRLSDYDYRNIHDHRNMLDLMNYYANNTNNMSASMRYDDVLESISSTYDTIL